MTNTKIKVGINGFGRIGRSFLRLAYSHYPNIDIVGINDLGDVDNLAYLLRYDTAHGASGLDIVVAPDQKSMTVNGKTIRILQEKDPSQLPWKELEVDVVIESTGFFTDYDKAAAHLDGGAKRVVISAPVKGTPREGIRSGMALLGINDDTIQSCQITSNASCTTNASSPVISILNETIGIEKALLNTTHAYTATQGIVDGPAKGGKDYRGGRAAAQNIVPSSTGAAIAVTQVLPELEGKFDGISLRVPVVSGSIVDVTFLASRTTTVEEINQILTDAAKQSKWQGIFTVSNEPLVSTDIVGSTYASIADLGLTRVVDGNLVKVLAWYDNEMGYTNTLIRHAIEITKGI